MEFDDTCLDHPVDVENMDKSTVADDILQNPPRRIQKQPNKIKSLGYKYGGNRLGWNHGRQQDSPKSPTL